MLFYTFDFAIFFGVVYAGAWLLNRHAVAWKLWMLAASYYFYAYWDWRFVLLLAASTLIAHVGATGITAASSERARRAWLIGSIVGLLGLLGYFKYYSFFAVSVDNALRGVGLGDAVPLRDGDGLALEDGRIIAVAAAPEPLAEIRAANAAELLRLAWHLGNRHLPTELRADCIRIRRDHVIEEMVEGLGGMIVRIDAPFDPEGGAYQGGGHHHRHDHPEHHEHDDRLGDVEARGG